MAQKYVYPQVCSFICWVLGLGIGGGAGYVLATSMGQDLAKSGVIGLALTLVAGLFLRRILCRRAVKDQDEWLDRIPSAEEATGDAAGAVTGAAMVSPELQAHLDEDYVEEEEVYAADEPAIPPLTAEPPMPEPAPQPVPEPEIAAAPQPEPDPAFEKELADALADSQQEPEPAIAEPILQQVETVAAEEPALTVNVPEEVEDGDDLTAIEGVDDDMAVELYALGINSIEQIATMGPGQIGLLAEQIPGVEGASVVRQWKRNARGLLDAQTGG